MDKYFYHFDKIASPIFDRSQQLLVGKKIENWISFDKK